MGITTEVCISCGKLFLYPGFGSKYCPLCKRVDDENRDKVKAYLREHGAANMYQIADATGVPESVVKSYLRDGTLEIPENSPIYIKCELCGCDIRSGRWCPSCAATLSNGFKGIYAGVGDVPKNKSTGKMRFLGRDR